jgi:hypothetical protein
LHFRAFDAETRAEKLAVARRGRYRPDAMLLQR